MTQKPALTFSPTDSAFNPERLEAALEELDRLLSEPVLSVGDLMLNAMRERMQGEQTKGSGE